MIAILGGLGAALAWATSTICSSRSSRMIDPTSVVACVMVIGLVLTLPLVAASGIPHRLDGTPGLWLIVAGAGNVGGLLFAYGAMRIGQIALVAPLISTEGAVAAVIAFLVGESVAPAAGLTLAVIAVGIVLASVPERRFAETVASERHWEAVALAGGAALTFGVSLYAAGRAGAALPSVWVVLSARLIGSAFVTLPLALTGRLRLTRQALPLVAIAGVCEVLGFLAYTTGARHGIAVAAVLSSQFGALAAIGGYLLFKDQLSRMQVAGVAVVLVGVAVLSALRA
jgi:drug/metabolite transporter (DMT)-like permease